MRPSGILKQPAVTLLGAGTQGRRLAYMWSSRGREVRIVDEQPRQLAASLEYIDATRKALHAREEPSYGAVSTHAPGSLGEALQGSWLVVECVPEKLSIKRDVIAHLDSLAPKETIVASNSSSYRISEIVRGMKLRDETRVLSSHSYWPPEVPVLEIMGHATTNPAHISKMIYEAQHHGFKAFHCRHDSMGYIYNRIWAAIKRESLLVAAEGVAAPAEIDDIFKAVLGAKTGPFAQMDVVGLDVVRDIEQHYVESREGLPQEPLRYLDEFIREGRLGVKSGRGFYDHE